MTETTNIKVSHGIDSVRKGLRSIETFSGFFGGFSVSVAPDGRSATTKVPVLGDVSLRLVDYENGDLGVKFSPEKIGTRVQIHLVPDQDDATIINLKVVSNPDFGFFGKPLEATIKALIPKGLQKVREVLENTEF